MCDAEQKLPKNLIVIIWMFKHSIYFMLNNNSELISSAFFRCIASVNFSQYYKYNFV